MRRIIDECYNRARQVLTEHKELLARVAKALLERESLESDELDALIAGQPLPPDLPPVTPAPATQEVTSFPRPETPIPPALAPKATG